MSRHHVQKWGTLPHAYSGAPKMFAEPREWFADKRHVLMFTHKDPNLVLHLRSRTCRAEYPHQAADCGYLRNKLRSAE